MLTFPKIPYYVILNLLKARWIGPDRFGLKRLAGFVHDIRFWNNQYNDWQQIHWNPKSGKPDFEIVYIKELLDELQSQGKFLHDNVPAVLR